MPEKMAGKSSRYRKYAIIGAASAAAAVAVFLTVSYFMEPEGEIVTDAGPEIETFPEEIDPAPAPLEDPAAIEPHDPFLAPNDGLVVPGPYPDSPEEGQDLP